MHIFAVLPTLRDIIALFLNLGEKKCSLSSFRQISLSSEKGFLLANLLRTVLKSWMVVKLCQISFLPLLKQINSLKLLAWWTAVTDFYVKPTLQSWDKHYLVMIDWLRDQTINHIYMYISTLHIWPANIFLLRIFWIHAHERYWSIIFFPWNDFVWYCY